MDTGDTLDHTCELHRYRKTARQKRTSGNDSDIENLCFGFSECGRWFRRWVRRDVPYPRKTDTTFCYFISCSYFWRERPVVADLNPHFVIIIMSTFPGLPGRIGAKMEYRPADIFVAPPGAATRNLKVAHLHSEHRGRIAGPY